ncbi:hypothetical protein DPMN_060058 [Dreissena polymorpha]|uniref:Uncharacterized protein n=1 Tax=Dreissena polymorpha TaxID=45954 RepID=A0A9D4HHT2_DREPO|nr:hypothetical protein DPMN_060058 [Dreissena polymorpha]
MNMCLTHMQVGTPTNLKVREIPSGKESTHAETTVTEGTDSTGIVKEEEHGSLLVNLKENVNEHDEARTGTSVKEKEIVSDMYDSYIFFYNNRSIRLFIRI